MRPPTPTSVVLACTFATLGCATAPATDTPPDADEPPPIGRALPREDVSPPTEEAAQRLVMDAYVEADTLIGAREPVGRFRHAGATATDLLPEPEFCHVYFALAEGTWCYRAQYGEPFQTRRVDPFSRARAPAAAELVRRAAAVPYDSIRDLLFLSEYVEAEDLACASFFVRQVLLSLEGARFETFLDAPTGLVADGISCVDGGVRWALYKPSPQTAAYRLWDRAPLGDHEVAVILRQGNEVAWFEVYAIAAGTPTLVAAVELWP